MACRISRRQQRTRHCKRRSLASQQAMLQPISRFFLAACGVELGLGRTTVRDKDMALEASDPRKVQEGMVATVTVPPVLLTAEATLEVQVAAAAPLADLPVVLAWV